MLKKVPALTLVALLAGCATQAPPPPDAIPGKRHTTQELLAYKPGDFHWTMTEKPAEEAMRAQAVAQLRARLALPPGEAAAAELPAILGAVMQFNTEIDAARGPTLAALPGLPAKAPDYQRAVLAATHLLYAEEAAPLLWPLLPQLGTPREFAAAAYTLLKAQQAPDVPRHPGGDDPALPRLGQRAPAARAELRAAW